MKILFPMLIDTGNSSNVVSNLNALSDDGHSDDGGQSPMEGLHIDTSFRSITSGEPTSRSIASRSALGPVGQKDGDDKEIEARLCMYSLLPYLYGHW